jgi:hypothetical protein
MNCSVLTSLREIQTSELLICRVRYIVMLFGIVLRGYEQSCLLNEMPSIATVHNVILFQVKYNYTNV